MIVNCCRLQVLRVFLLQRVPFTLYFNMDLISNFVATVDYAGISCILSVQRYLQLLTGSLFEALRHETCER